MGRRLARLWLWAVRSPGNCGAEWLPAGYYRMPRWQRRLIGWAWRRVSPGPHLD